MALCRRTETQTSTLVHLATVVPSLTDIAEQQNLNFNKLTLPNFRNGLTVFQNPPQRQAPNVSSNPTSDRSRSGRTFKLNSPHTFWHICKMHKADTQKPTLQKSQNFADAQLPFVNLTIFAPNEKMAGHYIIIYHRSRNVHSLLRGR